MARFRRSFHVLAFLGGVLIAVLTASPSIPTAQRKSGPESARYHTLQDAQPRAIDVEFEKVAKQLKTPAPKRQKKRGKK